MHTDLYILGTYTDMNWPNQLRNFSSSYYSLCYNVIAASDGVAGFCWIETIDTLVPIPAQKIAFLSEFRNHPPLSPRSPLFRGIESNWYLRQSLQNILLILKSARWVDE